MKRLLLHIVIFLLALGVVFTFLDNYFDKTLENGACQKAHWILRHQNTTVHHAFFGSSRVYNMLDPQVFSQATGKAALNLGLSGAGYEEIYLALHEFLENNHPEVLFFQIDPGSFNSKKTFKRFFHTEDYIPYLGKSDFITEQIKQFNDKKNFFVWRYIPFAAYAEFNIEYPLSRVLSGYDQCSYTFNGQNGYAPVDPKKKARLVGMTHLDDKPNKTRDWIEQETVLYIKKCLALAQESNIPTIIYTAPQNLQAQPIVKPGAYKTMVDSLEAWSEQYNTTFINAFYLPEVSPIDSLFNDPAHLNHNGTVAFTEWLAQTFLKEGSIE